MIDITSRFSDCVVAQAEGKNVLILRRLTVPIRRFDGKIASYMLEYRWLSQEVTNAAEDQSEVCVAGADFSFLTNREAKKLQNDDVNLFNEFDLV